MSHDHRLKVWLGWLAGLGALGAVAPLCLAWQRLPSPLATHFGAHGLPDGKLPKFAFALTLVGQLALTSLLVWPWSRSKPAAEAALAVPFRLGVSGFANSLLAALSVVSIWHNWERATWSEARPFEAWLLVPVVGLPLLVGASLAVLGWRLWPRPRAVAAAVDALPLAQGERAYWSGIAQNRWFAWIAVGLLLEAGVVHLVVSKSVLGSHVSLWTHVLVVVVLEHLSQIRVSVNERAITIHYGHLGWLKQRIALERVRVATAFDLEPMAHGGWGYRGSLTLAGRAAVVVRSGSAVRLDLTNGKRLSITVDDAETAARLINGFVQREGTARPTALAAS